MFFLHGREPMQTMRDNCREVTFYTVEKNELLAVSNREFTVIFNQNWAWTLSSIMFKGKKINTATGATGTVIHWINPETGKLDWAGTGHGRETVEAVDLIVDGITNRLVVGGKNVYDQTKKINGQKISLVKQSVIGPISHEARFDLPATGNYYIVTQRYHFNESVDAGRFEGGYTFMQMMPRTMNEWLALADNGSMQTGRIDVAAIDADEKSKITSIQWGSIKALVCYSLEWRTGIAYAYAKEYPGKNNIHQRPRKDIKYYGSLMTNICYNAGDKLEFRLKIVPFEAKPNEWKEKGKALAMEAGF